MIYYAIKDVKLNYRGKPEEFVVGDKIEGLSSQLSKFLVTNGYVSTDAPKAKGAKPKAKATKKENMTATIEHNLSESAEEPSEEFSEEVEKG